MTSTAPRNNRLKNSLVLIVLAVIVIELSVRLGGLIDTPLYRTGGESAYLPQPNQHGQFLRSNSWFYNDRSMGVARNWDAKRWRNVLLIGNSIVSGGNPYDQKDKLASLLQSDLGEADAVWPISAGGWTNVNEIAYLDANPDVANASTLFVWEFMAGGLSQPSEWRGEFSFPTHYPWCATCYLLQRYVAPHVFGFTRNELPPTGALRSDYLARMDGALATLAQHSPARTPGILLLYPTLDDLRKARAGGEWLSERPALEALAQKYHLVMIDVARAPIWLEEDYRDGVHPTVAGNVKLAAIIALAAKPILASVTR